MNAKTPKKETRKKVLHQGGFRDKAKKIRDRNYIAGLYVKNYGLSEMAEMLAVYVREQGDNYTLSSQQIWYDIRKILIEWKQQRLESIDDHIEKELRKLDKMENELWTAWEKSKVGKRKTKIKGGSVNGTAIEGGTVSERQTETGNGDPRFFRLLNETGERRAKLLGYNAPLKIQMIPQKPEEKIINIDYNQINPEIFLNLADALQDANCIRE